VVDYDKLLQQADSCQAAQPLVRDLARAIRALRGEPVAWASEDTLRAFSYGLVASTSPKRTAHYCRPLYAPDKPGV
jgi:hypothetical protein